MNRTATTAPHDVLWAAFTAEGAIEAIHDLTSLETASKALLNYEKVLLDASPEAQLEARQQAFEDGLTIPTVFALLHAYTTAWKALYLSIHATNLPLDPAI